MTQEKYIYPWFVGLVLDVDRYTYWEVIDAIGDYYGILDSSRSQSAGARNYPYSNINYRKILSRD